MPEGGFLIFWIFLLFFFFEFSRSGWVRTEFGSKIFFFLFLDLSQPGFDRDITKMKFSNFWKFFCYFFWNFLAQVGTDFETIFFSSAYLNSVWIEIMPEWSFFIFSKFLLFFSEFSCLGWVQNSRRIFFFLFLGIYQPDLDRNIAGMLLFNFF